MDGGRRIRARAWLEGRGDVDALVGHATGDGKTRGGGVGGGERRGRDRRVHQLRGQQRRCRREERRRMGRRRSEGCLEGDMLLQIWWLRLLRQLCQVRGR